TSLSLILLSVCMLIWYIQNVISRKHCYGTLSGKSTNANQVKDSLVIRIVSSGYVLIVLGLSIGIPYFSIIATSLLKTRGEALSLGNITFSHYTDLFTVGSNSFQALMNSINFAFVASNITAGIRFCPSLYIKDDKMKPHQFHHFSNRLTTNIPVNL